MVNNEYNNLIKETEDSPEWKDISNILQNKRGNYVMSCSEEDLVEWWY